MQELQIFKNKELGEIRTILIDNQPYFVGKDVAETLGYTNTNKAIKDHVDEEDKLTERIVMSGQNREVILINESGLYSLILTSKLPSANKFKRWVTNEVLPSIRETGAYNTNQSKQLTALEQLQLQSEAILEVNTKVDGVIEEVEDLKNNTTISYGQQEVINRTAKEVVVHALGGKDTPAYKELNKKVFSSFWKDYKRVMQVASYRDTLIKDYDKALDFIIAWYPNRDLELMIIGCNAQLEMEAVHEN